MTVILQNLGEVPPTPVIPGVPTQTQPTSDVTNKLNLPEVKPKSYTADDGV